MKMRKEDKMYLGRQSLSQAGDESDEDVLPCALADMLIVAY